MGPPVEPLARLAAAAETVKQLRIPSLTTATAAATAAAAITSPDRKNDSLHAYLETYTPESTAKRRKMP